MLSPTDGLLDTNVFIHAFSTDEHSEECRGLLSALRSGRIRARLEPVILHELSYALPRYVKQLSRGDVGRYLLMVLSWEGVTGDKDALVDTVQRWQSSPGLSFADAYLAALATRRHRAVYSKNVRELHGHGAVVLDPLIS